ncbi:MAG: DUF3160 domain-containing protein, partial [Candidatus Kapabacteria bacterium]|nr:DUF3160 domain-containing protein [Candidatus Kapabacteria bacterium]
FENYHNAFYDGFIKDLPVYISADAVLHAYHRSYSGVLKGIEKSMLYVHLTDALKNAVQHLRGLPPSHRPAELQARVDVDVLLTTALILCATEDLQLDSSLVRSPNKSTIDAILAKIDMEQAGVLTEFTSVPRTYDFSQMKPRGHYAGDPLLEAYFRALMWLGRTEIYITAPEGVEPEVPPSDVLRQCNMAVELGKILQASGAVESLEKIETLLSALIGEQDNLSAGSLATIIADQQLTPDALQDTTTLKQFQRAAIAAGAGQQILSQILIGSGGDKPITPSASFMVMGQRFLLDSYILSNVVHDKVSKRLMPSPLDAMFVLGNDATAQLHKPVIDSFGYAANLAALRFLTTSLEPAYWENSVYTTWLAAIRGVSPPTDRSSLPKFMQTSAWWQKSINTQLGSWAELRHDNLLYGKQSYTGGLGCFYPKGFVEPVPETYEFISKGAKQLAQAVSALAAESDKKNLAVIVKMLESLNSIQYVTDVLQSIAMKELSGESLSTTEVKFIDEWLVLDRYFPDCVPHLTGHYHTMFYGVTSQVGHQGSDHIIADVHTQPTDEFGNIVGRVLHVGTGYTNMAIIIAEDPTDKCLTAYAGPVGSYYEHITENFNRLTDQEWAELTESNKTKSTPFVRPLWTNLYLANMKGEQSGTDMPTLNLVATSVQNDPTQTGADNIVVSPNPTYRSVLITLTLPNAMAKPVHVSVVDMNGKTITILSTSSQESGTHLIRWEGTDASGIEVPSGTYSVVAHTADGVVFQRIVITR